MVTTTGYDSEKQAFAALSTLLIPAFDNETPKLNRIDRWWRWNPKPIRLNVGATPEHRMLRDMGETPWLGLVVTTLAQTLYLEGVDSETQDTGDAQRFWEPWQRNRMGERQIALHREAIAYGTAYTAVQGEDTPDGLHARIDCWSPRDAIALYDDPASDNWPQIFMRRRKLGDKTIEYQLWDAWSIWTWRRTGGTWAFDGQTPHGVASPDGDPVCPIVRYCNQRDLQGRVPGEVEPYIRMASRLNKDNYDRMLAQHYNSWKVKTATGLDMSGLTEAEKEAKKLQIEHDSQHRRGQDQRRRGTRRGQPDTDHRVRQDDQRRRRRHRGITRRILRETKRTPTRVRRQPHGHAPTRLIRRRTPGRRRQLPPLPQMGRHRHENPQPSSRRTRQSRPNAPHPQPTRLGHDPRHLQTTSRRMARIRSPTPLRRRHRSPDPNRTTQRKRSIRRWHRRLRETS